MSRNRRSFTTEDKVDAAHRVIDSGRSIEGLLGRWVAEELPAPGRRQSHRPGAAHGR